MSVNRRGFMAVSTAAGLAWAAPAVLGAEKDKKYKTALIGSGWWGMNILGEAIDAGRSDVVAMCDVDLGQLEPAVAKAQKKTGRTPRKYTDFRELLEKEKPEIAIVATPDHWHALGTIMACQAGKDVYVEKPLAHNIWEGRKMVEAARKYKRVVQVGMQTRSAPYMKHAADYIQSGKLGDIHLIRVFNMMKHSAMKEGAVRPVPDEFDYDMWCGAAPKLPYNPSRQWLNLWEYSCGPIAGDAIHQLDLARYLIGDKPYPDTVSQTGAVNALLDGRKTPDTQIATYEYGKFTLLFEAALWTPYMKKTPATIRNTDQFPNWPFSSTKVEVLGTKGFMYFGRHGGGWEAYDAQGELVRSEYGRQADKEHQDNFIDCIRTRKKPTSDVEIGHLSVLPFHMANISYRVGNKRLEIDPQTERFTNCDEANTYLKRTYRAPWIVPDNV